jgi:hypothetical protein
MDRIKIYLTIVLSLVAFVSKAQESVETDSVATALNEVVVTADSQIETAKKVIVRPTKLDKKHSTNGYALLENLNLPDFTVNASAKTIATNTGRDVTILINGVETQPEELATLATSQIVQIDYQRNPGGRYVGSGAVMNFITAQYDYGGNVYVSEDVGFARRYDESTGMVNYKKRAVTISLTANARGDEASQLNSAENIFALNDGVLAQSISPIESKTRTNSQYLSFKFAHAANYHSFDIAASLTRSATPKNFLTNQVAYTELYDFGSTVTRNSTDSGLSPLLRMHYNLYLSGGHALMANADVRYGHTKFRSNYAETNADEIENNTVENNVLTNATLGYFKQFASGLTIGMSVNEYYNYYHDKYSGSYGSTQTLTNSQTSALLNVYQYLPSGLYYYATAGANNLYSSIGDHSDNQFSPVAYYGVTYTINQKQSVSVSGNYVHTIYDPSYKNDAVIRSSFFEATLGNPDLGQLKAFQNMVSYNGRFGHFGLSFTYDFLKYFDNTSNRYFAEDNIMYHQLVNDGYFYYHKLIFSLTANLLSNRLRLKADVLFNNNHFCSSYRPAKGNYLRPDFSASYMFGDWQVKGSYALPYKSLGIEGTKLRYPGQYGFSLNWHRGDWAAECCVENFLNRRMCTRTDANYVAYSSELHSLSDLKGRNISLSITYILPYGKKTDRGQIETESHINSAILRPF